ncbi:MULTISPECIES: efflux RND transporter periplasmic adaptor subunit [Microbacterium]|uniref:Biotin/lipoyl-binding protein n=1 Tax=Microbacterium sufflavum TaxID=2851649 RepID=A0ABY4IIM0_9MICO|nr:MULTISPECIES: biotin/lipoyl-binding protein [Microbacterium]MBN6190205.1 biotin/lipoyl-binding protein [Aneurinibacillus sp. BA2021]MCK2026949.1 biotin/lipoyl-binding protein [Microbacterium sufflavum]UPL11711.1 biotin/lipoyl-binding protein [Microbacterium sufflavum]
MLVWRRWVLPLLLVVIFGACAAALVKIAFFPDRSEAIVSPEAGITDPVVAVERGAVVNALSLDGTVARDESYPVRSELNGTVTAVHVADGASVAAGQKLFTVRQDDPRKDIDVLAPEAGDVSELAIVKGQATTVGTETYTLTPARYHLQATVEPVQLYRLVNAPTEATVTITGGPAPFPCTGVRVQVSEEGTASVRCAIPADQTVFAGLPATMDLALGQVDDALVIPVTAVQGGAGTGKVWVDAGDGGEPEEREVALGVNDGSMVEVTDGLAEGDSIRQFVPGFVAPVEEFCYEISPGVEQCDSGMSW